MARTKQTARKRRKQAEQEEEAKARAAADTAATARTKQTTGDEAPRKRKQDQDSSCASASTTTTKKMRGVTGDGRVRVRRTVLRRVVEDRLRSLLRGDFYVRDRLGEEDYDPIMKEVEALSVPDTANPAPPSPAAESGRRVEGGRRANGSLPGSGAKRDRQRHRSSPRELPRHEFSPELETFIQLVATSIMIDASMRGEGAGESDTRVIRKKKNLLAETLRGPKLGDFRREVLRFDRLRRGEDFTEEEIVESEGSSDSREEESKSDTEEEKGEAPRKRKQNETRTMASEGSREIEAARRGVAAARELHDVASKSEERLRADMDRLRAALDEARALKRSSAEKLAAAENFLLEAEERWQVIDVDDGSKTVGSDGEEEKRRNKKPFWRSRSDGGRSA